MDDRAVAAADAAAIGDIVLHIETLNFFAQKKITTVRAADTAFPESGPF